MAEVVISAEFDCGTEKVWDTVTSLQNYGWRSDISRIEITGENSFTEFTKGGFATKFTVTERVPLKIWRFDIENDNIIGDWRGEFFDLGGKTRVVFTERVSAKKLLMRPLVKPYLKSQQKKYIADLEKALK